MLHAMASLRAMGSIKLLLCGVLAGAAALWMGQARLVFEPYAPLVSADVAHEEVEIPMPGGRVTGWWIPSAAPDAKTVLYLHGNDDNVTTSVKEIAPLQELGYSVLLIDYRGFGRSDGAFPTERAVYEDASAAWNFLVSEMKVKPQDLYIYGHSLGGAIAIELANRHPESAGLIVESSFTSIYDMARLDPRYLLLPLNPLLNQRFDSAAKVVSLKLPVLYLHGTADEVVPFDMGKRLFSSTPAAQFVAIQGGRHDHDAAGAAVIRTAIRSFVEGRANAAIAAFYTQ